MLKTPRPDHAPRLDIAHRPRRNRKAEWARRLVRENLVPQWLLVELLPLLMQREPATLYGRQPRRIFARGVHPQS